jgi:hypothetical protein
VVRPDARRHGQLELLGLGQPLGCEVAGVETGYGESVRVSRTG